MRSPGQMTAVLMATLLTVSLVAAAAALGGLGAVTANHPDDAPDLTDEANFVVNLPHSTDHLPGDQNHQNGSIQYFASGADAFAVQNAEDGVFLDSVIVHAEYEGEDWIDYSACDTPNTEAFGIDRGNNNDGVEFDEDLVSRQRSSDFRDDGIVIRFYEWSDFGGDPPYMAPEDAVVAAQGQGSAAGACLTLTDEPGWYRIAAFMNGTVADNGPDQQPSESASEVSLELNSNYLYVCDCDDEQEAREQLGAPPDEAAGADDRTAEADVESTPTPEPADDIDENDEDGDISPADGDTPSNESETNETTDDETDGNETEPDDVREEDDDNRSTAPDDESAETAPEMHAPADEPEVGMSGTPTPGDGSGFGVLGALFGVLGAALLVRHSGPNL